MKTLTRRAAFAQDIYETDERRAKESAQAWVIGEARAKAPYSYADLHAAFKATGTGAVKALLATVPADLIRLQAIRFCVERFESNPTDSACWWGWDTVEEIEARFRRYAAEGIAAAQRKATADAQQSAELAPHSYGDLAEAEREGTLGYVLSSLAPDLFQAQALRYLVGQKAITGQAWDWDDVTATAQRFEALAQGWRRALRGTLDAESEADAEAQTALDVRDESGCEVTHQARMIAALARLEADAERGIVAAKGDGDAELAKIARRSAQA